MVRENNGMNSLPYQLPDQLQTNKQFYYIRWPIICRLRGGIQSFIWGVTMV